MSKQTDLCKLKINDKVIIDVPEQYDRETYEGTLTKIDDYVGKVEFENGLWRWDYLKKMKKVSMDANAGKQNKYEKECKIQT